MLRNLTANLITHERIETTDAKAKELRRVAERLITKAVRIGAVAQQKDADLTGADKATRPLVPIRGSFPLPHARPPGCNFGPRCDHFVAGRCDAGRADAQLGQQAQA